MRKEKFIDNEYYHIFNRGVDKRSVFLNKNDIDRFFRGMIEFNVEKPIGSLYQNSFRKEKDTKQINSQDKIVNFICYCLNPNHYHFILQQIRNKGIERFMHRIGIGYTKYFNEKMERSGVLFQGTFKAVHIDKNEYLLHLSAYVNLNSKIHQLRNSVSKSSWDEYLNKESSICDKKIILRQFKNITSYKKFAKESLKDIQERKDMENLLLEE